MIMFKTASAETSVLWKQNIKELVICGKAEFS